MTVGSQIETLPFVFNTSSHIDSVSAVGTIILQLRLVAAHDTSALRSCDCVVSRLFLFAHILDQTGAALLPWHGLDTSSCHWEC